MMALCGPHEDTQGEERMAFSIAKAANWLHQVHRAHAVVGWWPDQFAIEDERTAYKVQDALLKKLVPKQGPLVGYKIALTSPQIWEQTGFARSRLRPNPQEARVRAQGLGARRPVGETGRRARSHPHRQRRLCRGPKDKPYDKDSIEPYIGEARAGFELIEDRGADYGRLTLPWLVMDVGWNGGSLLAKPNKNWKSLDIGNLNGSIAFDGKVMREGNSGEVLGHCYNALAWLANKLGEHGKTLKKGMIVSTGSMVACQFVPPAAPPSARSTASAK
jgi:2-keto-4-pentenoate hydratase